MVQLTRAVRGVFNVSLFNSPAWKKYYYGMKGYNKYGLYQDDFYNSWTNVLVQEAVRRLPADVYDQMAFRNVRASQLEFTKEYLPESQWPSYEEDETKGKYLEPYVQLVLKEKKEKEEWLSYILKE